LEAFYGLELRVDYRQGEICRGNSSKRITFSKSVISEIGFLKIKKYYTEKIQTLGD
jgi:hypothetical protein